MRTTLYHTTLHYTTLFPTILCHVGDKNHLNSFGIDFFARILQIFMENKENFKLCFFQIEKRRVWKKNVVD